MVYVGTWLWMGGNNTCMGMIDCGMMVEFFWGVILGECEE